MDAKQIKQGKRSTQSVFLGVASVQRQSDLPWSPQLRLEQMGSNASELCVTAVSGGKTRSAFFALDSHQHLIEFGLRDVLKIS